jgi:hypothetical protein
MEVHHHSHTARKKWTHYFWEFFMLFLAVFAGFLAENWREHIVEHKRSKQLAFSIYDDIKNDTAALNNSISFTQEKMQHIDSLTGDLRRNSWNDTTLTIHFQWLIRSQVFERSKATYEQLKNSGALRYFDQEIVKLLNMYDVDAAEIERRESSELNVILSRVVVLAMQTVNIEVVYDNMFDSPVKHDYYVKIKDKDRADYLINESIGVKILRRRVLTLYEKILPLAKEILGLLQKEYHLK